MNFLIVKGENMVIQNGSRVSFEYTLTVDGQVVDSSEGKDPLQYTHGEGNIIPGLAKQLEGLGVGDEKAITVSAEEGYGTVDPQALREIEKSKLPPTLEPQIDMFLNMSTPDGRSFPVRIAEVKENTVVLDFNHPLAGKNLNFQVKIISVQ
jgi:FKBP-type peptidyl-prolyl cis-trans isomerase 2